MNEKTITSEEYLNHLLRLPLPKIEEAGLVLFPLKLKSPFETSFGSVDHRQVLACRLKGEGLEGYGECVADEDPLYSYETTSTAWELLEKYLFPLVKDASTLEVFLAKAAIFRGHHMAKACLEGALWDILSRSLNQPLYRLWGGTKDHIPCGVSIGLQKNIPELLDSVRNYLSDGYRRIKIKIKPGKDLNLLEAIRSEFSDIPLMADANAAYTLADTQLLRSMDEYRLMMIEQPLHYEDVYDHSMLQLQMQTPVCLDESIVSFHLAKAAVALKSCRIINIKTGRVGGHTESIRIHNLAMRHEIPVWCGGMLESGIGRAHNLALASLPNFQLPGDTSASNRYWHRDIIDPAVEMDPEGFVHIPEKPGIGYDVDQQYLESLVTKRFVWKR